MNTTGCYLRWRGFAYVEGAEGVANEAEGAAVVGVSEGKVVMRKDSLLHETATLLAAAHCLLIIELGGRTTHGSKTKLIGKENERFSLYQSIGIVVDKSQSMFMQLQNSEEYPTTLMVETARFVKHDRRRSGTSWQSKAEANVSEREVLD
ncbi:hypothetical protein PIB30_094981 [Stylosanthes scabra]|uniref:Uncharacterized protein n=1 Tax=Stylosanthes scabra TaxID=79078 RepID=A0ABU6SXY6_9FABA|nr:hypothetical protein [Stylosanthes scabra]